MFCHWRVEDLQLQRHEILHSARTYVEMCHRMMVCDRSTLYAFRPCTLPLQDQGTQVNGGCANYTHPDISRLMNLRQAEDFCNKTVPIFIIPSTYSMCLLLITFHNWLYRKWFQPYRSELEYGQYIAKIIIPDHLPQDIDLTSLLRQTKIIHAAICTEVTKVQQKVKEFPRDADTDSPDWDFARRKSIDKAKRDQRFFILQPLFRAMAIVLLNDNFNLDVKDFGQLPVLIILTGVEDGLSAPLTFEPIEHKIDDRISDTVVQISLEAAVDFVLELERREIAAFGPRPDPVESTKDLEDGCEFYLKDYPEEMRKLGWGDEPVEGPSSCWVDTDKYPSWTGISADDDKVCCTGKEELQRRLLVRRIAEHNISLAPCGLVLPKYPTRTVTGHI